MPAYPNCLEKRPLNDSMCIHWYLWCTSMRTHTHPFSGFLSRTTWVSRYQKKHSPSHTFPANEPSFISFLHLPQTIALSLPNLRAWQSFRTTSNHVLFGLPLGLEHSTSYSIHFFSQLLSSFRNTCPYYRNLFCCGTEIMSCIPSLSQLLIWNSDFQLNATHPSDNDHSHLCPLKCLHLCLMVY